MSDWGPVHLIAIFDGSDRPAWWQWRRRRKRMRPILFDPDSRQVVGGDGELVATDCLTVVLR